MALSRGLFSEYWSIENNYKPKANDYSSLWIATEKIHGSNFSVIITNDQIIGCKRSGPLEPTEFFYDWKNMIEKYKSDFKIIFDQIKLHFNCDHIQIYGELFGGSKSRPVQKEPFYSNDYSFLIFDIRINNYYISFTEMYNLTLLLNLKTVPVLATGTLEQLAAVSPIFNSVISNQENNYSEGFVLRADTRQEKHCRSIFKIKNPKYREYNNIQSKNTFSKYATIIIPFLTLSRYNNIISKNGPETHPLKLIHLCIIDAINDAKTYGNYIPEERIGNVKKELVAFCNNLFLNNAF
jgi:Rnl2 family RNA ligase